jgi:hypothetical protein
MTRERCTGWLGLVSKILIAIGFKPIAIFNYLNPVL